MTIQQTKWLIILGLLVFMLLERNWKNRGK